MIKTTPEQAGHDVPQQYQNCIFNVKLVSQTRSPHKLQEQQDLKT